MADVGAQRAPNRKELVQTADRPSGCENDLTLLFVERSRQGWRHPVEARSDLRPSKKVNDHAYARALMKA
jgi:hypothetical protein